MANLEVKRLLLRYRIASISTLILGLALSTLAYLAADSRERGAIQRAFDEAALNVEAAITAGLERSIDQVESVGALFDSANDTSHTQFHVFAKQLLARSHGIQALEWIPRVPSAMRANYEKAAQATYPNFQFTEREIQGEMLRAGQREEYFPVYYVAPVAGNETAIGFDLASNPERLEALRKSRDKGTVVATARITLVQEKGTQYGFLLFRPVYRSGFPTNTDEQRHNALLGFALGGFRAGDVIEAATAHLQSSGVKADIFDESAPETQRFLASWPSIGQGKASADRQSQLKSDLERRESFDFGGRRWTLVLTPTKQLYTTVLPRPVWMTLVVGTLLTVLLVAYIEAARKHLRVELESREAKLSAEEKLTDILGSIDSILMSVVPGTGELIYANRAAERIFGRSNAELMANKKLWLDAIHPDEQTRMYQQLSLPLAKAEWSDEYRIVRRDGQVHWLGAKAKAVPDADGQGTRIDIVASDISEQRRAEQDRHQSEEKFKLLFNAAGDVIDIHRPNGPFLEVNRAAIARWGYSREELLRMTPADFVAPERRVGMGARTAEIMRAGSLLFDTKTIAKDGSVLFGEVHASLIDYDGAPAILTVTRDTTERKQAEEKIQQAVLRYRTLFEEAPVGIVIIDEATGFAVECNEVAHRQLGYSQEEFLHLKVSDYALVANADQIKARSAEILSKGQGSFDAQHRTKNGEIRNVRVAMRVLTMDERRFLYCIYEDVTQQRRGEIALQRANRALKTLSAANERLVHATSENELLRDVCRIVADGGYRMAGICYAQDDPQKSVKPMAWAGAEECCIAEEIQAWADTEHGQMPISRALQSGKPELDRDIPNDPALARSRNTALSRGYASVLALPLFDGARIFGGLCVYASEADAFDGEETRLLEELASDLSFGVTTLRSKAERDRLAFEHEHHEEILRKSLEESIQAIADTVEMRDSYTAGHQRRVGELAVAIAQELGLPEDKIHGIRLAASVHDLGKIKVPAEILAKPGKLTSIEIMLMQGHAQAGYDILKDIAYPWPIATIVWQHHERLDGSGYPQGLENGEILLESRIMTVADVVEAMSSHRPYRASLGMEAALAEIERGRGSAYDPAVVDACLELVREGRFAFTS